MSPSGAETWARSSWTDFILNRSDHPSGVNIGFADGSVRFVEDSIGGQARLGPMGDRHPKRE
jgi:prepilin-type processing-associated H-X9-DG protein